MSMAPAFSAAAGVGGLATGVKIASVRLCSGLSHQLGLLTRIVFSPALRSLSMNGPVPMALRVAKFSSFLIMSAALTALFFSAQAFDMMLIDCHLSASSGSGTLVVTSTRKSLIFLISFSVEKLPFMLEPGPLARLIEKTTSSAVQGVASLQLSIWARSKKQSC